MLCSVGFFFFLKYRSSLFAESCIIYWLPVPKELSIQNLVKPLNPFMPNGFSNLYPILGSLGGSFQFYSNFERNFCKQTVENLDLFFALFADVPQKGCSLRLIWVKGRMMAFSNFVPFICRP